VYGVLRALCSYILIGSFCTAPLQILDAQPLYLTVAKILIQLIAFLLYQPEIG